MIPLKTIEWKENIRSNNTLHLLIIQFTILSFVLYKFLYFGFLLWIFNATLAFWTAHFWLEIQHYMKNEKEMRRKKAQTINYREYLFTLLIPFGIIVNAPLLVISAVCAILALLPAIILTVPFSIFLL